MLQLAPGVSQLAGFPRNQINIYVVESVLVDAGTLAARRRILRQVKGLDLQANLVTHGHPNHFGSSRAICTRLGIPLWAGVVDREAIETAIPATGGRPTGSAHGQVPVGARPLGHQGVARRGRGRRLHRARGPRALARAHRPVA